MKKLFAIVIALAMLLSAAALAEETFTGAWYLIQMEEEDAVYVPADMGMEMVIELNEDGTAVGTNSQGGESETHEGTWAIEDDGISVTIEGEPMVFVPTDGNLVADSNGLKMVFSRERAEVEAFVLADVKADAVEADYAGRWMAFKMNADGTFVNSSLLGEDFSADIEGTTITLNGIFFDGDSFAAAFEDGALIFTETDTENNMIAGLKAQLLQDGNLSLTMTVSDDLQFIMQRAAE